MGLDPQTHEPFTSCSTTIKAPASPATRHMAQWESARLEAEARLSRESSLFNPIPSGRTDSDYYLRIWNSEVGESFRKFNRVDKTASQSPVSQASSSTKCGSLSAVSTEIGPIFAGNNQNEDIECKSCKSYTEEMMAGSDSSSSEDLEDSSDTALQLLLDFPINNDMSFLEEDIDKYAMPSAMLTENSFICHLWSMPRMLAVLCILKPLPHEVCAFFLGVLKFVKELREQWVRLSRSVLVDFLAECS